MIQEKLEEIKKIEEQFIEITHNGYKNIADNTFFLDAVLNVTNKLKLQLKNAVSAEDPNLAIVDTGIQTMQNLYTQVKKFEGLYNICTRL